MKKIAILTGSGISAESGLKTFREADGLWEGHDVTEVASPEGWEKNRGVVLQFYNERRKQAFSAKPNEGHLSLVELEKYFDVTVITQNVDNLHEQAGSEKVIHLHGELFKARSTIDPKLVYDIEGWELNEGDTCELGSQLRPHIVWFGEMVPMMEVAARIVMDSEIFIVIGTSMVVYPAAGLIDFTTSSTVKFVVDPNIPFLDGYHNLFKFEEPATTGVPKMVEILKNEYQ